MKFLFIVQGEGRGHLTQAITLEEILRRNGHEVVEVLVGKSSSRRLPGFFNRNIHAPVKRFVSPNFLPTPANKRVSLMRSVAYNLVKLPVYINSINYIRQRIEASGADRVINFYELLTGLTYFLFRPSVPQICIGHQYLFLHKSFEFPKADKVSLALLKFFTVLTSLGAKERLALSFRYMKDDPQNNIRVIPPLLRKEVTLHEPYSGDYIHGYMVNAGFSENVMKWQKDDPQNNIRVIPPLLRKEVTLHEPYSGDYIHGYMVNAGFSENVMKWHRQHPRIPLRFFWDKWEEEPVKRVDNTLSFYQLDDVEFLRQMAGCKAYASTAGFESVCEAMYLGKPIEFLRQMAGCKAYASTAGFESVCEAMYLGKPILMVPAHIEQDCNAYDAKKSGAGIISSDFNLQQLLEFAKDYHPNRDFVYWVRGAEYTLLNLLESDSSNYQQVLFNEMYLVEEFI